MDELNNQEEFVRISKRVARWLIDYAKQLIDDGYGINYNPFLATDYQSDRPGFIDEIPMENGELWRYMNAVINYARTVAGILAQQLDPVTDPDLGLLDFDEHKEI
nr:hypothetical protein [Cressdnaviricota sp.]